MITIPAIVDWVVTVPLGTPSNPVEVIRFHYTPTETGEVQVEYMMDVVTDLTFSADEWQTRTPQLQGFVERAFSVNLGLRGYVEPGLEITFTEDGTNLKFEADGFTREIVWNGDGTLTRKAFLASPPITVATWLLYHQNVSRLISNNS